ncbi:hypothetical protein XI25_30115 [Paenibacillus sp. DMB20]|nr:hypothetical protein XI25_30115 [Paenibacillus sp. DMB20]
MNGLSVKAPVSAAVRKGRTDESRLARFFFRDAPGTLFMRVFMSLPVFGLFAEWLIPLRGLGGDNGSLLLESLFMLAGFLLLQGLTTLREWVWFPLNAVIVVLMWGSLFEAGNPATWLSRYIQVTLPQDFSVFGGPWQFSDLSGETRAVILLLGWGIMVSAVQMLVLHRGSIWLFGGTTLVYLAVLEAGLELSVYSGMFRASCWILIVQGFMHFMRVQAEANSGTGSSPAGEKEKREGVLFLRWSLYVLAVTAATAGMVSAGGAWMPPVSGSGLSISGMAEKLKQWSAGGLEDTELSEKISLTGYDTLSQDMGGPLIPGKELFFTAESPVPVYWRGEALDQYTGRRWIGKEDGVDPANKSAGSVKSAAEIEDQSKGNRVVQKITLAQTASDGMPLFSGGFITKVMETADYGGAEVNPVLAVDPLSGTLRFQENSHRVSSYTVEARLPVPPERLRHSKTTASVTAADSELLVNLKLPKHLPQRIRDLGSKLTSGYAGTYEKARAVESYLEQNYAYTLKTKVPPPGRDFADHFLFDAKEGYCSHFATAMVVLLRSQGIPSRYVIGFAPGQKVEGTANAYRVTQGEAHAWVEVYFQGQGWAAFDPTPGFDAGEAPVLEDEAPTAKPLNLSGRMMETLQTLWSSVSRWSGAHGPFLIALFLLLFIPLMAALISASVRKGNRISGGNACVKPSTDRDRLLLASTRVWRRLEKHYGPFQPGTTVKKYIQSLDIKDSDLSQELVLFSIRWEKAAYGKQPLSRTEKVQYLRQCRTLVKKLG